MTPPRSPARRRRTAVGGVATTLAVLLAAVLATLAAASCRGGDWRVTQTYGGATSIVLVNQVQSLVALYGVAVDDRNVDRYLAADDITAANLWPRVRSARITVRFVNPYAGAPGEPPTIDWVQHVNLMNRT